MTRRTAQNLIVLGTITIVVLFYLIGFYNSSIIDYFKNVNNHLGFIYAISGLELFIITIIVIKLKYKTKSGEYYRRETETLETKNFELLHQIVLQKETIKALKKNNLKCKKVK